MRRRALGWLTTMVALSCGCAAPRLPAAIEPEPPSALVDVGLPAPSLVPVIPTDPTPALVAIPAPAPALPAVLAEPVEPRSSALRSGFHNPMPGGVMAGYQADTGLDIAGSPRPVYALASGTLDYSEPGHTLWTGAADTANCARFELDAPIPWKGRQITHVYYAHLSRLAHLQPEGALPRRHVEAGEVLGRSGVANHSPHLHIGLLLDGEVEQYWGTFLLADEVRKVLGGYRNGDVLPKE